MEIRKENGHVVGVIREGARSYSYGWRFYPVKADYRSGYYTDSLMHLDWYGYELDYNVAIYVKDEIVLLDIFCRKGKYYHRGIIKGDKL